MIYTIEILTREEIHQCRFEISMKEGINPINRQLNHAWQYANGEDDDGVVLIELVYHLYPRVNKNISNRMDIFLHHVENVYNGFF